jgi:hypothetical protein
MPPPSWPGEAPLPPRGVPRSGPDPPAFSPTPPRHLKDCRRHPWEAFPRAFFDSRMSPPDLLRGTGKSIGGDLDVDDEGSEQCQFESVQSLHHSSIGYQPVHTRIALAKKAMFLQVNREHKQEQERTILNCR